ncbi:protein aveugle [Ctenocephalides felis]|uniref:protein aveugle n=1 Tax=Ctenocephalides felis TaxID=7515 RepID=UPI000E6E244F|nr:protein aveugle [Ctenocephalides felis]
MVEEVLNTSKAKVKTARPKPVYLWTAVDVVKWLKRHCQDYYNEHVQKFKDHEITGQSLVRLNENTLLRMGILNNEHREGILREIIKLQLKRDIMEIRDLERNYNMNDYY